jgi:hypothetical protein
VEVEVEVMAVYPTVAVVVQEQADLHQGAVDQMQDLVDVPPEAGAAVGAVFLH